MVNTHLKIQQTEVTVGLERSTGRSRSPPDTAPAVAWGVPAPRVPGAGERRRGWRRSTSGGERRGFSHSASQRPAERKTEFQPGKQGQRPSARERREGPEAERGPRGAHTHRA